jgi:hypothetical protein
MYARLLGSEAPVAEEYSTRACATRLTASMIFQQRNNLENL